MSEQELRRLVEAARTWDEYEDARAAIRNALTPAACDRTDLADVCARKRRELEEASGA